MQKRNNAKSSDLSQDICIQELLRIAKCSSGVVSGYCEMVPWSKERMPNRIAVIVGIDEAGRGPLAGPVVAGACVDYKNFPPHLIQDSKQLTPDEREKAFLWIQEYCTYGIGISDASEIDRIGILEATQKAMQDALAEVAKTVIPTYVLIDGRDHFWFDYSHSSIIGGDQKEPCISAASIVAKVTRDRWMIETAHRQFPRGEGQGEGVKGIPLPLSLILSPRERRSPSPHPPPKKHPNDEQWKRQCLPSRQNHDTEIERRVLLRAEKFDEEAEYSIEHEKKRTRPPGERPPRTQMPETHSCNEDVVERIVDRHWMPQSLNTRNQYAPGQRRHRTVELLINEITDAPNGQSERCGNHHNIR
ncbi:ribonuclease HII [Candidatus Peregrinibacteria bacterium]|nr:ribonuclease HII [Candidatus Peregrinibacteria bacterium]